MPLNANAIFPSSDPDFIAFPSRRSVVHSTKGIVACTQPLASECGLKILRVGGSAAVGVFQTSIVVSSGLSTNYSRMRLLRLVS